jgi:hypothetical protein
MSSSSFGKTFVAKCQNFMMLRLVSILWPFVLDEFRIMYVTTLLIIYDQLPSPYINQNFQLI